MDGSGLRLLVDDVLLDQRQFLVQCRLSLIDLDSSLPNESDILVSFQKVITEGLDGNKDLDQPNYTVAWTDKGPYASADTTG